MKILVAAGIITLIAQGAACAEDFDLENGHAIAVERCAQCHAIGAEQASPLRGAIPFRIIVTRYPPSHLEEALAEGIVTGHPGMPEYVFEPKEIGDFIAYLESLVPETPQ